jgi:putative CocE/NonD family hydrolase
MNRKICMALLCLVSAGYCLGQQLYFPKQAVTDSAALTGAMPNLAKKIIAAYPPGTDRAAYLDHLFKLQMVANEYEKAIASIQALRTAGATDNHQFNGVRAIQYELFSEAKIQQVSANVSFTDAFKQYFRDLHSKLDDKTAIYISTAFLTRNGVAELKDDFHKSLAKQTGKDSIALNDAMALCESYNLLQVYRLVEPLARPLLTEDARNRYVIQDSMLIKTRDGAMISAIVVHKKGVTMPKSTILQFTIYTGAISDITRDCVARGYIGMIAFTRGKRFSPDKITPYEYEGRDCYDVIDWISKQKWSDGKVAMYGGSYNGFTQWAATKQLHPALKTIVPSASVAPGLDVPMMNNVFENFVFPWIYYVTNNKFLDFNDYNNTAQWDAVNVKWYATGKPHRVLDSLTGRGANRIFQSWIAHPSYDKYWQQMIPYKQDFAHINIPVLSTTGYYDGGQAGAMYYLREHLKYNKKAAHYLIIGPYSHFGSQGFVTIPDPEPVIAGYAIDPEANIHIHEIIFQWFDYILKGGKKPDILQDKINYQVMGSNKWEHKPSLAKMNNDTLRFYLSQKPSGDDHELTSQKPKKKAFFTENINFADRKTSNTFDHTDTIIRSKLDKSNGLVFISDPVKKSFTINGSFFGGMKVAINKKDMDYNINLYEQTPDGKYFYLSYFMGRASYAAGPGARKLLTPGRETTIPFANSYMTSRKISAGSRIVIVLSINKSQDNQINYGTGKEVATESIEDAKEPLRVKWYNSSYIALPVWQ